MVCLKNFSISAKAVVIQNDFSELNKPDEEQKTHKKKRFWLWVLIAVAALAGLVGVMFYKAGFTFSQMNVNIGGSVLPVLEDAPKVEKDEDRINILMLGLRGPEDPNGGLLTDTMIVLSVKKTTGQVAMISIPRDLYVKMPTVNGQNKAPAIKEKINFAYALGEETKQGAGLAFSKAVVSNVTGLYIDHVASVDFMAFKEVVDILGGVDVYLDKPFRETTQFAKEILLELPEGKNHLDGDTALYFVRSRYSTSDFDRAKRQQQVLVAMKDKALSAGILLNPVKDFELLSAMGKHVRTDMAMGDINNLLSLAGNFNSKNITHKVFDTTEEGLLYATTSDSGAYILLPVGDNFEKVRESCKNIFSN